MQQIEANITIQIPSELVLVEKAELVKLKKEQHIGKMLTMKDFCERTNRSTAWLRKNILLNPALIKRLDIENGGWVYYPASQSDKWMFKATGMINFIENELGKYLKGA